MHEVQLFGKAAQHGADARDRLVHLGVAAHTLMVGPPASPGWPIDTGGHVTGQRLLPLLH